MKRILPPLLLGLLLTLSACKPAEDVPTAVPTPTPTVSPTAVPTASLPPAPTEIAAPVWGKLEDSCRQNHPDKSDVVLVEGSFSLPSIENASGVAAYTAINGWYAELLESLKSDVLAEAAQAMDDYETSTALGDSFAGYSSEQTYEIMYETDSLVSILRTYYGYASGPYPTLLYMADRFDLQAGVFLNFSDFFTDDAAAETLIRAEVIRQGAEHADYDQAAISSAFNRENFYPTEAGFVFYYQPQTLNPQAATKPEFLISYEVLKDLMP